MANSFVITKDNLIGSIGTAMFQLKKFKENRSYSVDVNFFKKLIDFVDAANKDNYRDLLYDKHFIVSEEVLNSLHHELIDYNVDSKVDYASLTKLLASISTNSTDLQIEMLMEKLKEIALSLWHINGKGQTYM